MSIDIILVLLHNQSKILSAPPFAGVNYVNLSNKPERRLAFVSRLKTIGVEIDDSGSDWLSIGDFEK